MTKEQIEQKKQLLGEKLLQMKALYEEISNSGLMELSDEELDHAIGGFSPFYQGGGPMTPEQEAKYWQDTKETWQVVGEALEAIFTGKVFTKKFWDSL